MCLLPLSNLMTFYVWKSNFEMDNRGMFEYTFLICKSMCRLKKKSHWNKSVRKVTAACSFLLRLG